MEIDEEESSENEKDGFRIDADYNVFEKSGKSSIVSMG